MLFVGNVFKFYVNVLFRFKNCSGDEYLSVYDGIIIISVFVVELKCKDCMLILYFYLSG